VSAIVRPAIASDAHAVLSLASDFATSFAVDERAFLQSYEALLHLTDARLLVAESESDSAVIGYLLGFDHLTFFANGRVAWVEELTVEESHRRAGTGALLMRAFEAWARTRGCQLVGLATRRASAFYAAIGYEDSAVYFRKRL
jgi:GNAT superfamily N-acetyltransferase